MKNICVVLTNRAHWARLKALLHEINNNIDLNLQLIVGGSCLLDKYGEVVKQIGKEFKVIDTIYCVVQGNEPQNMVDTTALLMNKLTTVFARIKPDVVLVHADRYEQLAVAITASYMNIPVAHTQGGEITGSIDDKVRNSITQLADIHFPTTYKSYIRIKNMLNDIDKIYQVGCSSLDLIPNDLSINEFNEKYKDIGVGCDIDYNDPYIVVSFHPDTTKYKDMERQTEELIKAIISINFPTIWLWSNVDAGHDGIEGMIRRYREQGNLNHVRFIKTYPPEDFIRLIYNCNCLIGNTSVGIREGSFLGIPYVCIGTRQLNREHSENTILCPIESFAILHCYKMINNERFEKSKLYGDGTTSKKIVEVLKCLQ
jgi:UDP-hydrolysing UDP-N-acetyl-D-glucosamine 2-epimerase